MPPALVISLDFELLWGVRDHVGRDSPYVRNLLGARAAIPRLLELFRQRGVAATWATVGLLFFGARAEQEAATPALQPTYARAALNPYSEEVGPDEARDPLCFAATLLDQIRSTPRQELGTHTFGHFYCLEAGQTRAQFRADLEAACAAARRWGVDLRSLVFPRNQVNPEYLPVLTDLGLTCYRACEPNWANRPLQGPLVPFQRLYRLADTYLNLSGPNGVPWARGGLPHALPASRFLRPATGRRWLDNLQLARVEKAMEGAAARGHIFHLWWHPHNFGVRTDANLAGLQRLLDRYQRLQERYGMESLSMGETAARLG